MSVIGFHASHEQVHPAQLLDAVRHAQWIAQDQQLGFDVPVPAVALS